MNRQVFIVNECVSFLTIKIGLNILMILLLYLMLHFFQLQTQLSGFENMYQGSLLEKQIVRVQYSNFDQSGGVGKPLEVVSSVESFTGSQGHYFIKAGGQVVVDPTSKLILRDTEQFLINDQMYVRPDVIQVNPPMAEALSQEIDVVHTLYAAPTNDGNIPIILGAGYHDVYQIGDQIDMTWLVDSQEDQIIGHDIQYRVAGFFDEHAEILNYMTFDLEPILLDTYAMIPLTEEQATAASFWQPDLTFYFFPINHEDTHISPIRLHNEVGKLTDTGYERLSLQNGNSQIYFALQGVEVQRNEAASQLTLFLIFSVLQIFVILKLLVKQRMKVYKLFYGLGSTKKTLCIDVILSYTIWLITDCLILYLLNVFVLKQVWSLEVIVGSIGLWSLFMLLFLGIAIGKLFHRESMVL